MATLSAITQRMKSYERSMEQCIDANQYFIIRVDGRAFGKYCKGLSKPFDDRIYLAMLHTAGDLLVEFCGRSAYCFSDEISLVFAPNEIELSVQKQRTQEIQGLPYNGRVMKLCSLTAALASARFNYYMNLQRYDNQVSSGTIANIQQCKAIFDSRIFCLPNEDEVAQNIFWRAHDCLRNSKAAFAHHHLSNESLDHVRANEALQLVQRKKGLNWCDTPLWYRYGTLMKKKKIDYQGINKKTGQTESTQRSRLSYCSINLTAINTSVELCQLLLSKYALSDIAMEIMQPLVNEAR